MLRVVERDRDIDVNIPFGSADADVWAEVLLVKQSLLCVVPDTQDLQQTAEFGDNLVVPVEDDLPGEGALTENVHCGFCLLMAPATERLLVAGPELVKGQGLQSRPMHELPVSEGESCAGGDQERHGLIFVVLQAFRNLPLARFLRGQPLGVELLPGC